MRCDVRFSLLLSFLVKRKKNRAGKERGYMQPRHRLAILAISILLLPLAAAGAPAVKVEVEEDVYTFTPPNNGSGPLWSYGCTQVARLGDDVFISEMETGEGVPLLANTRWKLLRRSDAGWKVVAQPDGYRQREPCPLATTSRKLLFLNVNDSTQPPGTKYGACEPALLKFIFHGTESAQERLLPSWGEQPYYTDHSYRGFAADRKQDRLLMLNIDAKTSIEHACLMSENGKVLANGAITFPIRSCYPQVALCGNAAYVLAVGDIVEPVKEWKEYKFEQTKQTWDYVFRILHFTWTPDITKQPFANPIEIANVDATAGFIGNQDLWISPKGEAYILYTEREVQSALLRDKFFPGKSIINSLRLAVVKDGQVLSKKTLYEGSATSEPGCGRFHVAKDGTVYAVLYVNGAEAGNKLMQVYPEIENPALIPIPLKTPMGTYCLASVRAGNKPSNTIDMHGSTTGNTMAYVRIALQ